MNPSDLDFYKDLLDHMSDGVYFVDRDRRILYWNGGATRLSGYTSEELVGRLCNDNILCHVDYEGKKLCEDGCPLSASLGDGSSRDAHVFLQHKEGRRVPVTVRVEPMPGPDGSIIGAIEIFNDDSAQTEARRKVEGMRRLAFLDHLTQLPNRRFVAMSLDTALVEYHVHKDPFGVLAFDVDNFKAINDSFGHAFGDRALLEVAKTVVGSLRPADTVGRWGGDEFLAIVPNVNIETMRKLAERCVVMVARVSIPNSDGSAISLSISAGATLAFPGSTAEELIRRADELMYQSKASGRNRATTE
jgi:diguanylate cyclase (GGDEF)-like protein/PAS domain S-box-containing protein